MSNEHHDRGPFASDAYSIKWGSHIESPSRSRIRREVYGDEYPADVDPRSFLTWTELRRIARELRVGPGDTFVDLGCGQGGPCTDGGHDRTRDRCGPSRLKALEPHLAVHLLLAVAP
jgi:hypothetical protein